MIFFMDKNPLQEFPPVDEGTPGEQPKEQPNLITKWMESLAQLGLGESAMRIGMNAVTILVVILAAGIAVGTMGWTVFNQLVSVTDHMADFTYNINRKLETLKPNQSTNFSRAQEELGRLGQQIGNLNLDASGDPSQRQKKQLGASADHPIAVQEVGKTDRLDTIHGVLGSMVSVFLVVIGQASWASLTSSSLRSVAMT